MNNYCRNCGNKLINGAKKCPKCKVKILEDRVNVDIGKNEIESYKKRENRIVSIIAILLVIQIFFYLGFSHIKPLYILYILISPFFIFFESLLIIYARIVFNTNSFIKVVFVFFLVFLIIIAFKFVLLSVMCSH